jgi:hypothetical protein
MVISDESAQANRRNAQHSTGPKTAEGKAAVRFNALTWGLRARSLMIRGDDPQEYQRLWNELEAEWRPQTHTERYYLDQMCTAQWLLVRVTASETRVYDRESQIKEQLALLDRVDARRARLERSFTTAMHELQRLQKERRQPDAQSEQPVQTKPTAPASTPDVHPSPYVMSESQEAHPVSCAPLAPDTR